MNFRKNEKGITLLALIVTIIVLLILAGISIATLIGDNGITDNAKYAKIMTIHGAVKEQLQLEQMAFLTDKIVSKSNETLIEHLQAKGYIGEEIGINSGNYQINVVNVLGSRQSIGNGDATVELKDVYILSVQEDQYPDIDPIQDESKTNNYIINKIASTNPIRIAQVNNTKIEHKILYFGTQTSDDLVLGSIYDVGVSASGVVAGEDYSERLYELYYAGQLLEIDGHDIVNIFMGYNSEDSYPYAYYECNGGTYKFVFDDDDYDQLNDVHKVSSNVDLSTPGIYQIDGNNALVLMKNNSPKILMHQNFTDVYYLDGSNNPDPDHPLESGYEDSSGKPVLFYDDEGTQVNAKRALFLP